MPNTSWKKGQRRPHIKLSTRLELWARSAGRCEFRGCNVRVFHDDLTQDRSNLGTIAHIVAYSPNGPRGHPTRSGELATDIDNLMLTCKKHGDLIDDLDLVEKYDEELLRTFKREHEDRVRILTDVRDDRQSHVVFFRAPVDGHDLTIDERKAHRALLPNYPAEEHPFDIDLAGVGIPSSSPGFYEVMREALGRQVGELLRRRAGRSRPRSLSVFAIAPIPLLVQFGRHIGDVQSVDLYQHHRGPRSWSWAEEEEEEAFYRLVEPGSDEESDSPLVVIVSVSARIRPELLETIFDSDPVVYRLEATDVVEERVSGRDFLRSRTRLNVFGYEFRRLLDMIRSRHGHARPVHLFAAAPAPVAIEIGRNIKDVDPEFVVYDYQKSASGYAPALTLNTRL